MASTLNMTSTMPHIKLRYKLKQGCGKHWHGVGHARKAYVAGDIIEIDHIGQLGQALDKFEPADAVTPTTQEAVVNETKQQLVVLEPTLKPIHRGGGRWFVLNTKTEEFLNDAPLTKAQAHELAGVPMP